MPTVQYGAWVSVQSNNNIGLSQKVGNLLRWAANIIDGRVTLAVEILTIPTISKAQKAECIDKGIVAMQAAAKSYSEAEALELVMREHCGRLYEHKQGFIDTPPGMTG